MIKNRESLATQARADGYERIFGGLMLTFGLGPLLLFFGAAAAMNAGETVASNKAEDLLEAELYGAITIAILILYVLLMRQASRGTFIQ